MFLQETDLNVVPGGIIPVMHVSQYDVGRELKFVLYSGYDYASLESGTTVTIEGTKSDGHGFQYAGVLDQNAHTATFVTTEQMTVLAGAIECKLTLSLNSQRIGTALFILDVEKAGINDSTIISDTELPLIIAQATEQMERAEAAATAAAISETNAATSETNAAASETNAANSEIICGSFMRMAGVSAASAEQSAIISGSFMRTAGNYADEAEASAASANMDALKSEGHALGTQNGTPVSSDSPYYHNNAKYWADEARQSSAGGVAARVIATAEPTNISSHAYAIGDQFVYNGILYTATSAIPVGATITPGTNCSISDTITEQIGNAGKVTGVKGNAESSYRTGDVNISPADIGYFSGSTLSIGGTVPPSQNQGKFLKDNGSWESAGHTILDEDGTTYPQRNKLQFEGCEITDDAVNGVTVVKCEGGGTVIVEVPTVTNTELIYDGTTKSPTITRDTAHTTVTGTTEATEFGSYTFTISLSNLSYMWTDNTTAPKTYTWGVEYDGSTITPVNDIQTWLKCAMITDKSYTTLNEVLSDQTTLAALMLNHNAVDYLVRSTSWVSNITGNQTAMTDIGASDYCANKLLANSTWRTAICDSAYFESVLTTKVPTLSDNTNVVFSSGVTNYGKPAYLAFNGNLSRANYTYTGTTPMPGYIGYKFTNAVAIHAVGIESYVGNASIGWTSIYTDKTCKLMYSDDGTNWTKTSTTYKTPNTHDEVLTRTVEADNVTKHKYWALEMEEGYTSSGKTYLAIQQIQFYGRA